MGVANQCATKIGSLFVFSKGMFFFFRLDTKEKEPKRKDLRLLIFREHSYNPAFFQLLRCFLRLKGRNSLRSNSLPFLTPKKTPALDAEKTRPGDHAGWAVWRGTCVGGVGAYCSPFISRYSSMVCAGASFRSTVLSLFRR